MEENRSFLISCSNVCKQNSAYGYHYIRFMCGVCLYDPVIRVGGINHYMLPLWNGQGLASPKYGNIAIEKLLEKMISLGCQ